jgi:hypothetical protein
MPRRKLDAVLDEKEARAADTSQARAEYIARLFARQEFQTGVTIEKLCVVWQLGRERVQDLIDQGRAIARAQLGGCTTLRDEALYGFLQVKTAAFAMAGTVGPQLAWRYLHVGLQASEGIARLVSPDYERILQAEKEARQAEKEATKGLQTYIFRVETSPPLEDPDSN